MNMKQKKSVSFFYHGTHCCFMIICMFCIFSSMKSDKTFTNSQSHLTPSGRKRNLINKNSWGMMAWVWQEREVFWRGGGVRVLTGWRIRKGADVILQICEGGVANRTIDLCRVHIPLRAAATETQERFIETPSPLAGYSTWSKLFNKL